MSSTTEDSDWNKSPRTRRPPSFSHMATARPSPHQSPPPASGSPQSKTPRTNSFASTAAQLESQLAQTVAGSNISSTTQTPNPIPSALASIDGASHAALIQNTAEWEAARESVLSQMVTSQDFAENVTPMAKVARGGVKTGGRRGRGGRRPKVKIEGEDSMAAEMAAAAAGVKTEAPTRGKNRGGRPRGSRAGAQVNRGGRPRGSKTVNRGGRPRGSRAGMTAASALSHVASKKKRKRNDDDESGPNDTDVSEEFNLLAHTSSGRRITQAKTFSPTVLDVPASSTKKSAPNINNNSIPGPSTPTLKKPRPKRRKPGEAAVCINCGRGHSPTSNQIVFCDGCNTPWHQFCHDRPITPSVILIEEKEWLCSECATAREEKSHIDGKVAAQSSMTLAEKRTYLHSLPKPELVSLLLHAATLHTDLPIFLPPPPVSVPTIVEPRPLPVPIQSTLDEEEYVEMYLEQEPLPYPKAGNGLVLPREEDDLALLIDEDAAMFSHSWKGTRGWEGPGGMSWGMGKGIAGGAIGSEISGSGMANAGSGIAVSVGA